MDPIRESSIRVLMLPWLAHGHISPFLELAKSLSNRNFQIYLCSTPINLISIKQNLTQKTFTSIKLVEIPLPMLPDLPTHHHTTNGLPPHLMPTLKRAFDMSQPSFSNILDNIKPDLVIYDFLQPWAPQEALSRNIPVWERGLIVEGWATQAQILAHPSTGGFLSHCGWSSIMEGIEYGVPIIAIPMHLDQPLNARLVEEVGVGLEVERDGNGRLDREEIARVVKEVVRGKRGEIMRRKAKKLGEETREKGEEDMDGVVEELVKICK
ncbi:UDP-glucosyl transferase 72E1 [Actinidia rufa]|uniref:UDP-glucosyl transferase 72E1 n=1 Tax=Actinidia rufa TaxID=165716 RepID=A0A7J0GUV5_9ERIC|nr:UDP-glucosyl transferase 72E1 [Actinidia rufa]